LALNPQMAIIIIFVLFLLVFYVVKCHVKRLYTNKCKHGDIIKKLFKNIEQPLIV
jgi:hypothetical protein